VNELLSILDPFTFGENDCIDSIFDRGMRWLWSSDRRSFASAWYVDTELGFTGWGDFTCRYHVRAVCDGIGGEFAPK
jgi:serine/threonine-protein kinase